MKIVVTGGAGFIGSKFVSNALSQGHEVITIDKLTYAGNLENLGTHINHVNHTFYKEDICHKNEIEQIILKHEPEIIIHMAAESHVDRSIDCADDFIQTNIVGTQKLLEATLLYYNNMANKNKFRFLHLSTDEVYGTLGLNGKFDETMPYRPNSPYAASKAASDHLVRSYNKTYSLPTLIVNSSNNYGPNQYPEKLIPLTILNALEQKSLPVYGEGKQVRDWLYVDDHIDALFAIISSGKIGESYCVGADNEIDNLSLVKLICEILNQISPRKQSYENLITFVKDRPGHDFRYATNADKLKNHTGWSARTPFRKGLQQTIEWYFQRFEELRHNKDARSRIGLIS